MATIPELTDPSTTTILCHELQRGVAGDLARPGWPTAEAVTQAGVVDRLAPLFGTARELGVRVVHCGAAFRADKAGSFANAPLLEGRLSDEGYLVEGTASVDPLAELWDREADLVLHRFHGMSAFAGTELDWVLKSLGTRTVVVTGVSLNRGVTGTVIESVNYGYRVVVPRDGVVGYPPEYGEMVLTHTLAALAWLTDCDELGRAWRAPRDRSPSGGS